MVSINKDVLPETVSLLCELTDAFLIWNFLQKLYHIRRKRELGARGCEGVSA